MLRALGASIPELARRRVPITAGERDSLMRAGAAGAGGAPSTGMPAGVVGVSIPVGLPGGGPSRAQRQRDSVINADVSARLARIRARLAARVAARDSAARDSLARRGAGAARP